MTAIIFGANGQDGQYLSQLLSSEGIDTVGVSRSGNFLRVNISDWEQVSDLVKTYRPDYIFHLAANSTTRHDVWEENHYTISTGTLNLLEALRQFSAHTKIFLSGSGLQFRNEGRPIKETDPFEASSMYAVSRIHMTYAARYFRTLGLQVYIGYFFNHESPLRSERHVSKMIADAVKRIAAGSNEKITIGDWSVKKEWGFAGDSVEAIWTLVRQNTVFEATIGTGKAYSIWNWIELCFGRFNINAKDHVEKREVFLPEYNILVSDPSTILSLGWRPKTSFEKLADLMLDNHE
jgi:GDPmannose 4,6-dehydratase